MVKHSQRTQNKFAIFLQYLKENGKNEVDLLLADKHQRFLQIDTIILGVCGQVCSNYPNFWWGWSSIPKVTKIASLQCLYIILKKKLEIKLIFWNFLQVDFNTLYIKVFYKIILSLLMSMITHSQSTQINKLAIALQLKLVTLKLFNKNW